MHKANFITTTFSVLLAATLFNLSAGAASYRRVWVPANIDHTEYDRLLRTYVNKRGLVDYRTWKRNTKDSQALRSYLEQFASGSEKIASGNGEIASLINLYNALTLESILEVYPVESIREIDEVWTGRRFTVGGESVSIDDVEHGTLRGLIGWRVHAVVVCAARSCPPLQPYAYDVETLDETLDAVTRLWLGRIDLNRFSPSENVAEISKIFDWYEADFDAIGGVAAFLAIYAPERHKRFLDPKNVRIRHLPYHWGLNDQSGVGNEYRRGLF